MENDFSIRAYKIYILAKITIFREKIKSWFDHKENMVTVRMKRIDKPVLFAVKASQKICRLSCRGNGCQTIDFLTIQIYRIWVITASCAIYLKKRRRIFMIIQGGTETCWYVKQRAKEKNVHS